MSIEIIKQRIRMIENNDFSLSNDIINEDSVRPGSYTQKDFDAISQRKDAKNLFYKLGAANTHANDAEKNIKSAFSTGSNRVTIGDLVDLPKDYEKYIFPIYKLLKRYGILTDDLDDTKFKPVTGYKLEPSRNSKINNKLVLQSRRDISIIFKNDLKDNSTQTNNKLVEMNIDLSSFKSKNSANINNFINELTRNKTSYKISNINNSGSEEYLIKFN